MRLIDADALAARLENECREWEGESAYQAGLCAAAVIVAEAPTVKQEPTVGGWISVKDELPTQQGEYLVNVIQYCLGGFELAWFDGKVWSAPDGEEYTDNPANDDNTIGKVTHWMPLPEMPEEGEA